MSTWNKKNFSIYTSDERSALGLIEELGEQTNYNTEEIEKVKESDNKKVSHDEMNNKYKVDDNANFTGSWHGIKKPTASNEGLASTIDKICNEDIPNIKSDVNKKTSFDYVDTKIQEINNKVGSIGNTKVFKGSCLFSALPQSSNTNGDYYYVTDRSTNFCWNGSSWVDIGNNFNLADKTVSPSKTTFLEEIPFTNKLKTTEKQVIGNSLYIPIYLEPNTTYHVQHSTGFSGCFIGIYDTTKTNKLITINDWDVFSGGSGKNFNTESLVKGWYIFKFQIPTDIDSQSNAEVLKNNWMVSKGTMTVTYEDYKANFIFNDGVKVRSENFNSNSINNIALQEYGVQNIKFTFKDTITIDELTGTTAPSNGTRKGDESFKKVHANSRYYINFPCRIMFYDNSEKYISWVSRDDIEMTGRFFDTPSNCSLVRINVPFEFANTNTIFILSDDYVSLDNANREVYNPYRTLKKGRKSIFEGKKMVTDGHSIVAQGLWQQYLVNELGVIMHKNCGVGGTTITEMCSDERVNNIPTDTEILYLMAETNDHAQNIPLGNINSKHDNTTYYGAFQLWLDKIYSRIPNATVIVIGSPFKSVEYDANSHGLILDDYRKATKEVCRKYGYKHIDIKEKMNVNYLNYQKFIPDGTHPHTYGAKNMADIIVGETKTINLINYTIKYN